VACIWVAGGELISGARDLVARRSGASGRLTGTGKMGSVSKGRLYLEPCLMGRAAQPQMGEA
jgi:hypothetical protein